MNTDNNVNVINVNVKRDLKNNDNDNVSKYNKVRQIDVIADDIQEKLNLPLKSRPFVCLAAQQLTLARLYQHLETVTSGRKVDNPAGLFIYLCKKDGVCSRASN